MHCKCFYLGGNPEPKQNFLTDAFYSKRPLDLTLLTSYPDSAAHCISQSSTPTLTPLKSESTSESSRLSSCGTFLFFSRCSSRLFWQEGKKKRQKSYEGRRWKCSLVHSWILKATVNRGLPQKLFLSFSNFYFQESSLDDRNPTLSGQESEICLQAGPQSKYTFIFEGHWTFTLDTLHNLPPASTLSFRAHTEQQRDPHIPSIHRACESVVGGDSLALHSCASCWCASLMTNQLVQCFLPLWSS